VANVNLYYRIGAETWQEIAPGLNGANLVYNGWNIPDRITSPNYNVEIKIEDALDNTVSDTCSFPFKIKGDIYVTYPTSSGEELEVGKPITITWETTGGSMANVEILLSTNSGSTFPIQIKDSTPATYELKSGVEYKGQYVWNILPTAPIDKDCQIRVRDADEPDYLSLGVYDDSDNDFRLMADIEVLSPNTGSEIGYVSKDPGVSISWVVTGTVGQVKLYYSTNNGVTYTAIAGGEVGPGTSPFNWVIPSADPDIISDQCLIKMANNDLGETDVDDDSDNMFEIKGQLNFDEPSATTDYEVGDLVTFQWEAFGPIANVDIYYTNESSGISTTLYSGLASGTGVHTQGWTIPTDFPPLDLGAPLRFTVVDSLDDSVDDDTDVTCKIHGI
jgi:hypothetical protein